MEQNQSFLSETEEVNELFTVERVLGEGAFGKVYECREKEGGDSCAVKVILKDSVKRSRIGSTKQEAAILAKINHPNVVRHYGMKETETGIYIKMEVAQGGSLASLIKERKKQGRPFSEPEIAIMMKAVLQGVAHIHSLNIIHRDLKTQNILVSNPEDLSSLKIADFGLSIKVSYQSSVSTQCGTFLYMAPEILLKSGYSKAVDLYSCAVIMYTLFTMGKHPFYTPHMSSETYTKIINSSEFPALPFNLANNFLQKIGRASPLERFKAQQTLKHPWITRKFDDPIPLSAYQNFKGFENHEAIKAIFSAILVSHSIIFTPHKDQLRKVVDLQYLRKIEQYNKESLCRSKKLNSSCGSRLTKQYFEPFNKIIKHQKTESSCQKSSDSLKEYDKSNPAIEKLNHIFNNLFQKKADSKINFVNEVHSAEELKPVVISPAVIGKIEQLIQKSAVKFKRQSSNRKRIFQKRQSKSINKLSSTAEVSSCRSNITSENEGVKLKPTRTSIRLRELRTCKKTQEMKPPLRFKRI